MTGTPEPTTRPNPRADRLRVAPGLEVALDPPHWVRDEDTGYYDRTLWVRLGGHARWYMVMDVYARTARTSARELLHDDPDGFVLRSRIWPVADINPCGCRYSDLVLPDGRYTADGRSGCRGCGHQLTRHGFSERSAKVWDDVLGHHGDQWLLAADGVERAELALLDAADVCKEPHCLADAVTVGLCSRHHFIARVELGRYLTIMGEQARERARQAALRMIRRRR